MLMAASIGNRVREARLKAGLTQHQLAIAAGVTLSSVAQLEQDVIVNPRVNTLLALARALGVSLDELAGKEGNS